jgi:hypothetical protein
MAPQIKLKPITLRAGPFSVFFTNVNTKMALRGHSHFATVDLFWTADAPGQLTFPSFADTHADIQAKLIELLAKPLVDFANEDVATMLLLALAGYRTPAMLKWSDPPTYWLSALELHVRGVPDAIGHADSFSTYRVEVE